MSNTFYAQNNNFGYPYKCENRRNCIGGTLQRWIIYRYNHPAVYNGENITVKTTKQFENIKVMMWKDLKSLIPICQSENL